MTAITVKRSHKELKVRYVNTGTTGKNNINFRENMHNVQRISFRNGSDLGILIGFHGEYIVQKCSLELSYSVVHRECANGR